LDKLPLSALPSCIPTAAIAAKARIPAAPSRAGQRARPLASPLDQSTGGKRAILPSADALLASDLS